MVIFDIGVEYKQQIRVLNLSGTTPSAERDRAEMNPP